MQLFSLLLDHIILNQIKTQEPYCASTVLNQRVEAGLSWALWGGGSASFKTYLSTG